MDARGDRTDRGGHHLTLLRMAGRWPFTIVGVLTVGYVVLAAVGVVHPGSVFRVLILPMYIMRLGIVAIEMWIWNSGPPRWIDVMILPLLFSPYILVDRLLQRLVPSGRA